MGLLSKVIVLAVGILPRNSVSIGLRTAFATEENELQNSLPVLLSAVDMVAYSSGDEIVMSPAGNPGMKKDWVGVYPKSTGAPHCGSFGWSLSKNSATGEPISFASTAPDAGEYKICLLEDNTYIPDAEAAEFVGLTPYEEVIHSRDLLSASWSNIDGKLKQVSAQGNGNAWGVNWDNSIYYRDGNAWYKIPGELNHVSVSDDGNHVWGTNSADEGVYYRAGPFEPWNHVDGVSLKTVSVSGDGSHVWGTNSVDDIYYRAGFSGSWIHIAGSLKQISAQGNGSYWSVNSEYQIYDGLCDNWYDVPGGLKYVSVSDDGNHVWGTSSNDDIYYRAGAFGSWTLVDGKLKTVSVSGDGSHVWGTDSENDIFYRAGPPECWEMVDVM